jgi:prepilin-type N-terminal cleavage/methylation domain-containing protein/prepilin-type processing-associated H-X9-DG protein
MLVSRRSTGRSARNPRSQAGGFTLVELLVVITIIGILMALLLPALNAARDQTRRTQCMNNLKQLGIACQAHIEHQGFFPTGGWGWGWVGDPDRGFHKEQIGGWLYNLLPYLDNQAIHQNGAGQSATVKAQLNVTMIQTPLLFMNCPTRRRAVTYAIDTANSWGTYANVNGTVSLQARSDYAICTGDMLWDEWCSAPNVATGDGWPNCPSGDPKSQSCVSCWRNPSDYDGISFQRSEVKTSQVLDGMNQTILIGEKYIQPDYYYTGQDGGDNENMYVGYDNDLYRTAFYDRTKTYAYNLNNAKPPMQDTPGVGDSFRFGSAHQTTCNFVFCDGSVKNISYFVDPLVFANLCSRNDQNAVDEKSY